MSDSVRIDYEIQPEGQPELQKMVDTIRALLSEQEKLEQNFGQIDEAAAKAKQKLAELLPVLEKLSTSSGNGAGEPAVLKQFEDVRREVTQLIGVVKLFNDQPIAPKFDGSGTEKTKSQLREIVALMAEVERQERGSQLRAASGTGRINLQRRFAVEDASKLSGILPNAQLDEIEARLNAAYNRDVLTANLKTVNPLPVEAQNGKLTEQLAREQGGEQAVLDLRKQDLESIRQKLLLESKSVEEENAINAAVNRRIAAEEKFSSLRQDLQQRKDLLAAEEKREQAERRIVSLEQSELTGVQKINAERQKYLTVAETTEQKQRVNTVFDRRVQQEQAQPAEFRGRNLAQNALYAAYSPQYAAFGAASEFIGGLSTAGVVAGASAIGVGVLGVKIGELVKTEAEAAQETQNLATRLGISAQQAQQLSSAANIVGVNISSVEGGIRLLATALEDPAGQGKKAAGALTQLGVAIYETNGKAREMGPVFLDILQKLSQVPGAADRLALATRLLGRGAKEIEPLIADINELNKVTAHLGDNVENAKLVEANKRLNELHENWEQLKRDFAVTLTPTIEALVKRIDSAIAPDETDEYEKSHPGREYSADYKERTAQVGLYQAQDQLEAKSRLQSRTAATAADSDAAKSAAKDYLGALKTDAETAKDEAERALHEAQERQKTARNLLDAVASGNSQVTTDAERKAQTDEDQANRDVAAARARIKALSAVPREQNSIQERLEGLSEQEFRLHYPASQFGQLPQLISERQRFDYELTQGRDKDLPAGDKSRYRSAYDSVYQKQIQDAAEALAARRETKRYQDESVLTDTALENKQRDFATAERLAQINAPEKEGSPEAVNAAFERQLQLAKEIRDAHLSDLETLHSQQNAAERKLKTDEVQRQYAKDLATADSERVVALAEIARRERESQERTAIQIDRIRDHSNIDAIQERYAFDERMAELGFDDSTVSGRDGRSRVFRPKLGRDGALETHESFRPQHGGGSAHARAGEGEPFTPEQEYGRDLQIAQLIYETHLRDNQEIQDANEKRVADEKALADLIAERQKAEYVQEEKIAELRKQELESAKQSAASLYDALRGGPNGVRGFLKQQADTIGRNLFSEAAAPIFRNVSKSVDPNGSGILHRALQGTVFGGSQGADEKSQALQADLYHQQRQSAFFRGLFESNPYRPLAAPQTAQNLPPAPDIQVPQSDYSAATEAVQSAIIPLPSPAALRQSIEQSAHAGSQPASPLGILGVPASDADAGTTPLVTALDSNKASLDALTQAIVALSGDVQYASSRQPISIGNGSSDSSNPPVLDELGAHSLVQSTQHTRAAVEALANSPTQSNAALRNVQSVTSHAAQTGSAIASRNPIQIAKAGLGDVQALYNHYHRRNVTSNVGTLPAPSQSPNAGLSIPDLLNAGMGSSGAPSIDTGSVADLSVPDPTQAPGLGLPDLLNFGDATGSPDTQDAYSGPVYTPDGGSPNFSDTVTSTPLATDSASSPVYTPDGGAPNFSTEVTSTPLSDTASGSDQSFANNLARITAAFGSSDTGATSSGPSNAFGFNSEGAQALPQSLLNAANPFNNPLSAGMTLLKAGKDFLGGLNAGGIGGSSSSGGGGFFGGLSPDDISNLGGINAGELGQLAGGDSGSSSAGFMSGLGGLSGILGTGITAGTGIMGTISGFSKGGAKGDLSGISSGLGTAAMLDPEPISKAILGIAAGITAAVGDLMGDPRAQRQKQLAQEIEGDKIAAFGYTQPGITLTESAAGGNAVSLDRYGLPQIATGRPFIQTIQEAAGFDPLHPQNVVTRPVRMVEVPSDLAMLPSAQNLTPPQLPVSSGDLTPSVSNAPYSGSMTSQTAQAAAQSQQSNFQINLHLPISAFDSKDVIARKDAIADALSAALLSNHRISGDIRAAVQQT